MYDYVLRIVLVGEAVVGKTSLCDALSSGKTLSSYQATIGVDFSISDITTLDGKKIKCQLWDTAGCERFRSITKSYYQNAGIIILMFDLSKRESFSDLYYWIEEIRKHGNEETKILLIGNKSDLDREVGRMVIDEFVEQYCEVTYIEASVKTKYNEFYHSFREYITDIINNEEYSSNTKGISPGIEITEVKINERDNCWCC